jgi:hypothetical protein
MVWETATGLQENRPLIAHDQWKGQCKELTRARALLCDAMVGGKLYWSDLVSLDRYLFICHGSLKPNERHG